MGLKTCDLRKCVYLLAVEPIKRIYITNTSLSNFDVDVNMIITNNIMNC